LAAEGFAVITGRWPWIGWRPPTTARRRAAVDRSGLNINCLGSKALNAYVDLGLHFHYFFVRKLMFVPLRQRVRRAARRVGTLR